MDVIESFMLCLPKPNKMQIIEFKIILHLIIDISLKICWRFSFMNLMLATLGAIHSTSWELHWCSIFLLQNSVALVRVFSHLNLCGQIWGILWRHCSGAGNSDSGITPRGKSNQIRYMYELTSTFIGFLCLKLKKKCKNLNFWTLCYSDLVFQGEETAPRQTILNLPVKVLIISTPPRR